MLQPPTTTLNPSQLTYYFRKNVIITNPLQFVNFTLNLRRDDGVVLYLNGVEIFRNNLPKGTISYTTAANSANDDGAAIINLSFASSLFINGNNCFAAEIHNAATTSSDITFELELIGNQASTTPVITRGPYIQSTNAISSILRWKTNIPCNSKVQWGTSLSYGNILNDAALVTDHEIQLTGLSANTTYYYTIETASQYMQGNALNFLRTAPSSGKTRIWAIGDFGNGSTAQQSVLNSYVTYLGTNQNDIWLWLGDNAYETGDDYEYQANVFNVYANQFKSWNFFPALGNHDYGGVGYQSTTALGTNFPYFTNFTLPTLGQLGGIPSATEKYYSYNWSNVHFIALDSYGAFNKAGSPMFTWLQNDLMNNSQKWTVVYFHHPPFTKGTHNSDTEIELIDMRNNIVPLLETYGVDLVLNGHSHTYERSQFMHGHYGLESTFDNSMIVQSGNGNTTPYLKDATHNGTIYAVCGVGGKNSATTTPGFPHNAMNNSLTAINGSLVIEIEEDTLHYRFLKSDGTFPDQFKIIKPVSPNVVSLNVDLFLQGYYQGNSVMKTVLKNQGIGNNTFIVDTVLLKLHNTVFPFDEVASSKALLTRNGKAIAIFSSNTLGNTYYVSCSHRNSIQTWSNVPLLFSNTVMYHSFRNAANQAYGANQLEIEPGIYALFAGDINQDGALEIGDYAIWETDANNFEAGYFASDLDGDGAISTNDYSIWEANSNGFVGVVKP